MILDCLGQSKTEKETREMSFVTTEARSVQGTRAIR